MTETQKKRCRALVAVLRSGKYKKIKGKLQKGGNCYCLTGVMALVHKQRTKSKANFRYGGEIYSDTDKNCGYEYVNKEVIEKYYGLPILLELKHIEILESLYGREWWCMNDHTKLTFDQMADIIEREFINV